MWNILNEDLSLSCAVETAPGPDPKVTPQQDTRRTHTYARTPLTPLASPLLIPALRLFIFLRACVFNHICVCIFGQDMGQDVEPYFQEVLAALEQSTEESCRGEGGALRSRLQQLYSEIVGDRDTGGTSQKRNGTCTQAFSEAQLAQTFSRMGITKLQSSLRAQRWTRCHGSCSWDQAFDLVLFSSFLLDHIGRVSSLYFNVRIFISATSTSLHTIISLSHPVNLPPPPHPNGEAVD